MREKLQAKRAELLQALDWANEAVHQALAKAIVQGGLPVVPAALSTQKLALETLLLLVEAELSRQPA